MSGVDRDDGGDSVPELGKDRVAYGGDDKSFDNEDENPENFRARLGHRDCMLVKSCAHWAVRRWSVRVLVSEMRRVAESGITIS